MRSRAEAEASALLKLILCDYDELASQGALGEEPYSLEQRKKRVKRKVWGLLRLVEQQQL